MQKGNKERVLEVIFLVVMALAMHPQALAEKLFDLQGLIDKAATKRADDYRPAIVAADDVTNVTGMDKVRTGREN